MAKYECDKCGACCKELIVEVEWLDIVREPRIRDVADPFRIAHGEQFVDDDGEPIKDPDPYIAGAMLACGKTHPCPLLGSDNLCGIYPTRPNCCVAFEAGSRQCQESRQAYGLPPLKGNT